MREHAENPAGTGTALTAMLFSGGRAALAHRRVPRVPAPRWSTAPDSSLVAAGSLADARTACGRQARTVRPMWACGACGSAAGTCRVPTDPARSWTTERTFLY